jgi:hypothetical protein
VCGSRGREYILQAQALSSNPSTADGEKGGRNWQNILHNISSVTYNIIISSVHGILLP